MTENRKRILEMLAEGKISVDEAERLLTALNEDDRGSPGGTGSPSDHSSPPKYLRVIVEPNSAAGSNGGDQRVNVRVPLDLIRAGVKLAALIPAAASTSINEALRQKGIDMDVRNLKFDDLVALVDTLRDFEVDVQDGNQKVRVYVE